MILNARYDILILLADALVISALDDLHYRHTMRALELGYEILLEEPIAMTLEECEAIRDKAIECRAKVVVCHVLRYSRRRIRRNCFAVN